MLASLTTSSASSAAPADTADYDPTSLVVPLDQGAPNPYDDPGFDGKQDDVTDGNRIEGMGGDVLAESPLGVKQALRRLYDLAARRATVQWDGKTPIKGMCLSVQHNASEIGALHSDAQEDCDKNPDKHAVSYKTVEWSEVPDGSFVYFRVGEHGHIARKTTHNGNVLIISSDVRPGQIGYVDPLWFQEHWGAELEAWSRVCNETWQKAIAGNEQGDGGQWEGAVDARVAVGVLHNQILPALAKVHAIAAKFPHAPIWANADLRLDAVGTEVHAVHDELEKVTT